jgi:hypothetical protein
VNLTVHDALCFQSQTPSVIRIDAQATGRAADWVSVKSSLFFAPCSAKPGALSPLLNAAVHKFGNVRGNAAALRGATLLALFQEFSEIAASESPLKGRRSIGSSPGSRAIDPRRLGEIKPGPLRTR